MRRPMRWVGALLAFLLLAQLLTLPAFAATNQDQIWAYFKAQGFSEAGIAGIMGNLEAESGYWPNNLENAANEKSGVTDEEFTAMVDDGTITGEEFARSETYGLYTGDMYGYGLAQWTYWSRKQGLYEFCREKGTSIADLTMQLDYIMEELKTRKTLTAYLKEATDEADACLQFHNGYEGSSDTASRLTGRINMAKKVFEKYGAPQVSFPRVNTYRSGLFTDVASGQWFASNVAGAYELGLMKGTGQGSFTPGGSMTMAEAVAMAARIHSIYITGSENFAQTGTWYQVYLDYGVKHGILDKTLTAKEATATATRAQFAAVLAKALPADGLHAINTLTDGAIPDVDRSASYASSVYKLYRAGVLTGGDSQGTFSPDSTISRAEAAAIASRMADSSMRRTVELG